ncbi:hypothetical protein [Mesonia aestuariivivens]|uniref:SdiA-regulated domain-containing protein n=1 Tax=Mesonia aestuariivivens TaxID=2796128 RepID=A0ABS6W1K5_9FLAO|nr:hypothetical protein [Mesonia aestuariivivens]MBW2961710.1 SdiA-regulated domain-containing protein [Mesonia aestuariivivens]
MKTVFKIILGIFTLIGLTVFAFNQKQLKTKNNNYKIIHKWELPSVLQEISGIDWIGNDKIACIQDEDGIIFIYNLKNKNIEKQIDFADKGDYEDIVVLNEDAYVLRSDGVIFEIKNYLKNPSVKEHSTFNDATRNVEGLSLDETKSKLLLAVKDEKHKEKGFKGVYSFSLVTNRFQFLPIYKINLKENIFEATGKKKVHKRMRPSALTITNNGKEIYFLDGAQPKFLISDKKGNTKKLYHLDEEEFHQPEGITLTKDGRIFISNEGKKSKPNILEVEFY